MGDENQEFNEAAKKSAESLDKTTKNADKLTDALADLLDRTKNQQRLIESTQRNFSKLDEALKNGRRRYIDIGQDLQNLQDAINDVTDANEKEQLQKELNAKADKARVAQYSKLMLDGVGSLAASLVSAGISISKSVITSYQNNADAFQTAGDAAIAGIDSTNKTIKGVAGVAGAVGAGLMSIPGPSMAVGAALTAVAAGASFLSESMSDLAKFGVNVSVKELENTVKSYRTASAAGALFANGLTELRDSGAQALLTQDQFAKVISENNQNLAMFGGNVANGVKQFTLINGSMKNYRDGLIKLGYSVEDIAQGTADYMSLLAISGQGNRRDYANLAKETDAYLTNLKVISAFTGEDAKKMQARARDASAQAAVYSKLAQMPGDAAKNRAKFESMIGGLPPILQKAIQQKFALGEVVDPDLAAALAQMPGAMELVNKASGYASDSTLDASTATQALQKDIKDLSPELQKQANAVGDTVGVATLATGALGELSKVAEAMQQLSIKGMSQVENSTKDLVDKTKESTDKLTQSMADATIANQNLKISIQTELTPAIEKFASTASEILEGVHNQVVRLFGPKSTAGSAGGQVGSNARVVGGGGGEGDAAAIMETAEGGASAPAPTAPKGPLGSGRVPTAPGASLPGTLSTDYSGINLKSNESVAGGGAEPRLLDALRAVSSKYPDLRVSAINDTFHIGKTDSKHPFGKAADITYADGMSREKAQAILPTLKELMAGMSVDFHPKGYKGANADHIHAEMAMGGITRGTSIAGEAGPEAVIPLPDGRTIPVKMDVGELVEKMNDLINVMKEQRDISEKTLWATS